MLNTTQDKKKHMNIYKDDENLRFCLDMGIIMLYTI